MPEATEPAIIEVCRRRSGFAPAPDVEAVRESGRSIYGLKELPAAW